MADLHDIDMAAAENAPATATASGDLSRREEDTLRRDRSLAETLLLMDNYRPIVCRLGRVLPLLTL